MHIVPKDHRILVVDDIPDNRFFLKTLLEAEGYCVDVADTGRAALEKMQISPPDLILLDIMMPNMDGYELTRRIRQNPQFCSLPVVLITAHGEMCRIKGLAVGATDFVRKPFNFEALLRTIENLLIAKVKKSRHSMQ